MGRFSPPLRSGRFVTVVGLKKQMAPFFSGPSVCVSLMAGFSFSSFQLPALCNQFAADGSIDQAAAVSPPSFESEIKRIFQPSPFAMKRPIQIDANAIFSSFQQRVAIRQRLNKVDAFRTPEWTSSRCYQLLNLFEKLNFFVVCQFHFESTVKEADPLWLTILAFSATGRLIAADSSRWASDR